MSVQTILAWEDLLPPALNQAAYRSGAELAWPREQALEVLAVIEQNGRRILGVDVWILTQPGPTPVIYDWTEERVHDAGLPPTAGEFIKQFSWKKAGVSEQHQSPHFTFTVE